MMKMTRMRMVIMTEILRMMDRIYLVGDMMSPLTSGKDQLSSRVPESKKKVVML